MRSSSCHLPEKSNATVPSYIRSAALDKEITNIDGFQDMLPEINHIGNNLNQITILLRQSRMTKDNIKQHLNYRATTVENGFEEAGLLYEAYRLAGSLQK